MIGWITLALKILKLLHSWGLGILVENFSYEMDLSRSITNVHDFYAHAKMGLKIKS